jgi:hypothetical protein
MRKYAPPSHGAPVTSTLFDVGGTGRRSAPARAQLAFVIVVAGLCAAVGLAATMPAFIQIALALSIGVLLCVACISFPGAAGVSLIAWLAVLALVRRLLDSSGIGGSSNPLLLVSPIAVVLLVLVAGRRGAFRSRTPLTNRVLLLNLLVLLSAVNPLQGGLTVGVAGLLFVFVPMLWFWLGRAVIDDRRLSQLLRVIAVLSVPAAIYGLFQVYRGFPWWDARWIATKGYVALRVGDALRQFSSFASTTEYVGFLAVGALVWVLRLRRARSVVPAGLAVAIITWALVLASARAILVALPVALGLVFCASRGLTFAKSMVFALLGLVALGAGVAALGSGSVGGTRTSALVNRQVQGLANPFDANVSTLPGHIRQIRVGVTRAFTNPLGQGVGSITIAAEKFGGNALGTEADPSNIAVAAGLPGLILYSMVVVSGFRLAFRAAREERDRLSLVALGILVVTAFQWLNGGNYSVAPLPWLVLGWLDRRSASAADDAGSSGAEAPMSSPATSSPSSSTAMARS